MSQLTDNLFVLAPRKKEDARAEPGEAVVNPRRTSPRATFLPDRAHAVPDHGLLEEASFHKMISRERKRTERSRKPFLLMLLDLGNRLPVDKNGKVLDQILSALSLTTRETDITGWYGTQSVVGVMFTEISIDDKSSSLTSMVNRVSETLRSNLTAAQFNQIAISCHLFPEDWTHELPARQSNPTLYPDLSKRDESRKLFSVLKRVMDIVGSALALALFLPFFLLIAAVIKLTSPGPVFFRQNRVGQHGVPFVFLKFRSMHVNNDPSSHKEYVRQLIAGQPDGKRTTANSDGVYKMTNDPRITEIGAFLRRTSLDELPQFINVLTRRNVAGRTASSDCVRSRSLRSLASPPGARSEARNHRSLAGQRTQPRDLRRNGSSRSALCENLVALDGHQNPVPHSRCHVWWRALNELSNFI